MSTIPVQRNTLSHGERLRSRKLLDRLFSEGKTLAAPPFRLLYQETSYDSKFPVKVAFSAPKRRLKLAHERNRAKRLMREAFRKHKHPLYRWCRQQEKGLILLLISQSKTPSLYHVTEEKIILLLNRLIVKNENAAQ